MRPGTSQASASAASDAPAGPSFDPGSFRDRGSRIVHRDGRVFRALGARAHQELQAASAAPFFRRALERDRLIGTAYAEPGAVAGLPGGPWVAAVEHPRLPFVSYPYEWTFGMLKDAALLQLELLDAALADGFILKDASAYNVQWRGCSPVFIDVASVERYGAGSPWIAYRQFCQLFLYPLMLQAYRGAPFQPWLRGQVDGIPPPAFASLLGLRDLFRPGAFVHGWLHARASARLAATRPGAGPLPFTAELIRANVRRLDRLVRGLAWAPRASAWSEYAHCNSYQAADVAAKDAFVQGVLATRRRALVWDLGSNTGRYARMAAAHADCVVAMDADQVSLERLYGELRAGPERRILPLLVDLADPSPGLGWRGRERRTLDERGRPDLALALALVHHLVLAANVPLEDVVAWLGDLGAELVVEWVEREDPMVQRLLAGRPDFPDYRRDHFEGCLAARFEPRSRTVIPGGTRVLYHLVPRRP